MQYSTELYLQELACFYNIYVRNWVTREGELEEQNQKPNGKEKKVKEEVVLKSEC